ncbi:MAG: putative bifunctional diguanylate cyclase/phosphodiesterase [Eubacterium sp.]
MILTRAAESVLENVYNEYCKVRHSRGFLMLVGVDNFKELNEKYGAKTGDEVLNILTDAIRRYIDTQLRIFRMPGDECAIFMPYTIEDNIEQAKNLYKRIRNRIDRVIEHRKYDIFFTISAGAAEFDTERDSFNDLLKNAKFSLHAAKLNGKNRCEIFDSVNYMEYIKKLGIQDELRRCISEGFEGFELYFQPIYNPQNDKLSGAEALIRWNCSKYGFMEPDKFIPLLEESALIIPLGRWIIDTAAKACNRWITNIPDFVMHINLSFVQIVKSNIIKDVLERIGRYSAANNHYVFEITETIEMDRIPAVERVFKEFIKNDFRLAIDDFGTGYSNYGYMRDKIFDIVKVDRSFITDIDKQRNNYLMVSFIIKMAHEMGLHVCIEGVETKEELACVRELGADYIQGYYYGKPVCVADFEEQHLKKLILG